MNERAAISVSTPVAIASGWANASAPHRQADQTFEDVAAAARRAAIGMQGGPERERAVDE
jgi:hypothetical protein